MTSNTRFKEKENIKNYFESPGVDIANTSVSDIVDQFEEIKMTQLTNPPDTNTEICTLLQNIRDKVKKLTTAVGQNTKGIEEFWAGLWALQSVKTAGATVSDDLKDLKESVRVLVKILKKPF